MTSRTKKKNPFWKKPLKKLADLVSPPQPKRLLSGLPAEESLVSKEPPFLDFYDSLPNPTLKDTAGDIEKITNAVGDAGDKLIKLNGYYEEAKDKLGGGEKFEMIGAVFGHLQGIVDTVPFAGPIFACFKTFVDLEKAAKESLGAIGDLHGRVIFVLDTMRLLDKRYKWSKSDDFKHALKPLEVPIRMCSVLFLDYKEQSWFSRRLYGKDTVDKIKALDADLTTAMSDVRFAVGLTVAATMPAVSTVLDPSAQAQAAEQAVAVALSGGMTEFLKDPAKVTALGEELAKQLGERFDPGTMLAEVQRGFDERFNALDKSFKDVLDAVASQGKSIDEAKVMLDELSKRNSMYTQIRCVALRELWLTAGWGALVKMPDFIDVIVDKIRIDVTQVIARDKQLAKEDDTIAADLQVLYVGFADVLKAIDKDQSGKVSPKEANAFFAFHSWRLLDYFTLVSFFMTTTRAELLKSLQCELDLIARRLISPNKKNEYALFFSRLRLTITAMRDLAGEQSEFEGVLPYWLKKIPKLYDRNDILSRSLRRSKAALTRSSGTRSR
ncbi:hypothetical protein BC828DRAFT_373304 [Blastocladiella britannica]|nr:hypothetical protein BC828DRAFT_373304 [Blastocladiella britannica]